MTERVAVVGGHGKIAQLLLGELTRREIASVALVRNDDYRAELEALGAEVRILDIENDDVDDFAKAFDGCDVVVFTAGAGADGNADRKRTVDLGGSLKSIEAAKQRGVSRFIQVSAIGVDDSLPDDTAPVWRAYVEAKRDADIALRESGLDWTIIRPTTLTDDPATDQIWLGSDEHGRDHRADNVTRADVAAVVASVIESEHTLGVQAVLTGGTDTVESAVAALTA